MRRKISRILIILFVSLTMFTLTSCNKKVKEFKDMNTIIYPAMLNEDGKYLIFIYGDNCYYCEQLKPIITKYATLANKKKDYYPIYGLNSSNTRVNKGLIATGGDESYDDFRNTTNYEDIHISTTPVLIIVNEGKVTSYISSKTTLYPKTEIQEYITGLMK